jgi:hypothetical protein
MSNKRTQPEAFFDSVVDNAIDFLRQSLDELENKPKYSVIHFCASIELFLKARLMLEHWSLISEEPQRANITKFRTGNFRSVGIDETIARIQNIANIRIPHEAYVSFSELREHRNKMVHFFHPDYVEREASSSLNVKREKRLYPAICTVHTASCVKFDLTRSYGELSPLRTSPLSRKHIAL